MIEELKEEVEKVFGRKNSKKGHPCESLSIE
jgi:hypothetical protein